MSTTDARSHRTLAWRLAAAAAIAGSLAQTQAAGAATTPVGGGAFAVQANVKALVVPIDVGPLPAVTLPSGGSDPITASLLNTNVLGLVTVRTGDVSTEGKADPGTADSSATVANVDVAGLVTATVASSVCSATATGTTGSSKVVDLVVAGIPLALVDIGPNTKISLPVGSVTLNEQIGPSTAAGRSRSLRRTRRAKRRRSSRAVAPQSITVNAVHVHLDVLGLASGEVILGQSRCSVG